MVRVPQYKLPPNPDGKATAPSRHVLYPTLPVSIKMPPTVATASTHPADGDKQNADTPLVTPSPPTNDNWGRMSRQLSPRNNKVRRVILYCLTIHVMLLQTL